MEEDTEEREAPKHDGPHPLMRQTKKHIPPRTSDRVYTVKTGRRSKYKPYFCKKVIEYGIKGYSKRQMAREIGVDVSTLESWAHPESPTYQPIFSDAYRKALEYRIAFFEDKLIESTVDHRGRGGEGPHSNVNATIFALRNAAPNEYRANPEETVRTNDDKEINIFLEGTPLNKEV